MTEKQYRKADSMVLPAVLVIMIGIALNMLGMIATGGGTTPVFIALITSVVGALINIIVYLKLKGKRSELFSTEWSRYRFLRQKPYI